jgi:transcriptional regulator with XRE-family HTH domain
MAATNKARPATPEQIMKFGHVASALRKFMDEKGWKPKDLNKAIGYSASHSSAYQWTNGKGAPGPMVAQKVSKVTGIPVNQLLSRTGSTAIVTYKPSKYPVTTIHRPGEVLTFVVMNDGNARIKIDIVLPLDKATPLLRMLLDAGLVFSREQEV